MRQQHETPTPREMPQHRLYCRCARFARLNIPPSYGAHGSSGWLWNNLAAELPDLSGDKECVLFLSFLSMSSRIAVL
ncbi:MAG: hypothetical protein WCO14_05035 [bacterium]